MVRALFFLSLLLSGLLGDGLQERIRAVMAPKAYESHRKLIALLFENRGAYCRDGVCDAVKIVRTLRENGLLPTAFSGRRRVVLTMECAGEHPLFFMKEVRDTLKAMGITGALTQEAQMGEEGFRWSLAYEAGSVPDPVKFCERLARRGIVPLAIERLGDAHWRYRLDMRRARFDAMALKSGEVRNVVRPVRPIWLDVSRISQLSIRELPGSHWYADVVVYDKMLHILSMRQNDTRTRYLRLKLPEEAAYVKIGDRFTLENIRSGLRLGAQGAR